MASLILQNIYLTIIIYHLSIDMDRTIRYIQDNKKKSKHGF